ncbi:M35 family metallo-endopeptidase, partial [Enterobacter chuandaensis]
GLVDGVNLFRFVQNNPLRLFDPDGQAPLPYQINEESEKSTELNFGPIHTRGMTGPESMAPEKAKTLRAALSLASEFITDVRNKAGTKAIPGFSGVQAPELEKDLQKMLDMMADYQEGQTHAEAFAVYTLQSEAGSKSSSEEGYAHVYPEADHNIYLGPPFFTAGPIMQAKVLIHEFSHLALGTKDYRYSYEADKLLATGGLKPEYLMSLKKFLSEMATGPVTDTNPEPGKDFVTMMKTYNHRLVQAGITDQLSSLQAFLSEHVPEEHGLVSGLNALSSKPAVIKKMVYNNADSISSFIMFQGAVPVMKKKMKSTTLTT